MTLASAVGPMPVSVENALGIIVHQVPILGNLVSGQWTPLEENVIVQLRFPRVLSAALAGVALSTAGVVFQGIFRNPMADPYVLGVASGAGFGALLVILFGVGFSSLGLFYAIPFMAFIGAIFTLLLVYTIARTNSGIPILRLLLAGIAVSSFFSSIISLMIAMAGEGMHVAFNWLFGGFPVNRWEYVNVAAPIILLCLVAIYAFARDLNVMLLGEEQAEQLGVEVETMKKRLLILSSLITAVAVSMSGIVGFVGLIVPHMMRILIGPDHRILIPSSALAGASLLVLCDAAARTILRPIVLPTGIVTAMLGAPFFIYLLMKSRKITV
ncbi:iron ABC transporter permease [Candidatus Bathyarchaeota archaeon]|nr:iron ABC transporter permease [Candidatus Bathyarchaeota archaeon]